MSEGKRRSKSDLDDLRIVYQLEREIRCNADPTANVVVSALIAQEEAKHTEKAG